MSISMTSTILGTTRLFFFCVFSCILKSHHPCLSMLASVISCMRSCLHVCLCFFDVRVMKITLTFIPHILEKNIIMSGDVHVYGE